MIPGSRNAKSLVYLFHNIFIKMVRWKKFHFIKTVTIAFKVNILFGLQIISYLLVKQILSYLIYKINHFKHSEVDFEP